MTAYEMRISDWSSDVCSSDLRRPRSHLEVARELRPKRGFQRHVLAGHDHAGIGRSGSRDRKPVEQTAPVLIHDRNRKVMLAQDEAVRHQLVHAVQRSEKRRVGKAWVSTC